MGSLLSNEPIFCYKGGWGGSMPGMGKYIRCARCHNPLYELVRGTPAPGEVHSDVNSQDPAWRGVVDSLRPYEDDSWIKVLVTCEKCGLRHFILAYTGEDAG